MGQGGCEGCLDLAREGTLASLGCREARGVVVVTVLRCWTREEQGCKNKKIYS